MTVEEFERIALSLPGDICQATSRYWNRPSTPVFMAIASAADFSGDEPEMTSRGFWWQAVPPDQPDGVRGFWVATRTHADGAPWEPPIADDGDDA